MSVERIFLMVAIALGLSSCGVFESSSIGFLDARGNQSPYACSNHAGFYHLPKTVLTISVKAQNELGAEGVHDENKAATWHLITISHKRIADSRFGYCLEYNARANSNDDVMVLKYKENHLLGVVSSDVKDKSGLILQKLIQTIFVGISGNPNFALGSQARSFLSNDKKSVEVFRAKVDPFDPDEMARINQGLTQFGFCLLLSRFTINAGRGATIDDYCDGPEAVLRRAGAPHLHYKHHYQQVSGIYYRPRIPYTAYLFVKKNTWRRASDDQLAYKGDWILTKTEKIEMENISPIVSVGVDRTIFAERKISLIFDEGELRDVCIRKTSELLEAVQIPLVIVQSVVALPTNILQVKINDTRNDAALISAENEIIAAQNEQLNLLKRGPSQGGLENEFTAPQNANAGTVDGNSGDNFIKTRGPADGALDTLFNKICTVRTLDAGISLSDTNTLGTSSASGGSD